MLTFIHFFQDLYSHYFCDHKYVRMVKWGKHARKLRILVWKHSTSTSSKPFAISHRYKKRQQCGDTSITHDYFQNQNHEQMNSTQKHSNKMSKKNEEKNSRPYRGDLSRLLKIKTHRKEKFTSEVDKKSKKKQQKMKNKKTKALRRKTKAVCMLSIPFGNWFSVLLSSVLLTKDDEDEYCLAISNIHVLMGRGCYRNTKWRTIETD